MWHDGRDVAVKVQYPGAEEALRSDLRQLARMSRLLQPLVPGQDVKPLVAELRDRMEEELDYRDEAANQRAFAEVFDGDPQIAVPRVVASAPRAMVSEWVSGRKLSERHRGRHGGRAGPGGWAARRVPLLRPRPGRPPARGPASGQLPAAARRQAAGAGLRCGRAAARGPAAAAVGDDPARARGPAGRPHRALRNEGFLLPGTTVSGADLIAYLAPFAEPLRTETFHFTRRWLQSQAERVGDLRSSGFDVGRRLNLPPQYLLVHRVSMGTLGVLCQLDARVALRDIVSRWNPATFVDV